VLKQKNYISLYVCAVKDGKYLAEKYKRDLGKAAQSSGRASPKGWVSVGKSCIRFKKIKDVNLSVLKKVIQEAAKNPGLVFE